MADVPEKEELKNWYYQNFKAFESSLNGQSKSDLHKIRKEAMDKFIELGFPSTSNEEWKYTNIAPVLLHNYKPAHLLSDVSVKEQEIEKYLIPGLNVSLMVFVNGYFKAGLSNLLPETKEIKLANLSNAVDQLSDFPELNLERNIKIQDGFTALNAAFMYDGAVVRIPDDVVLENPIHLLFLSGSDEESTLVQPRNIVFVGKNSQVKIIESTHGISDKPYLLNSVTEIFTYDNSVTNYLKIQDDSNTSFQVNRTQVYQSASSVFTSNTITFGGELVRNDIYTLFEGQGCESNLYGLYLADGKRHIDNHTMIDHAVPHCQSSELYKGILDDRSRGVFNGKVIVRKDAQKTQAYQSNKNLLLSRFAKVDTKPQLEIFADDVKCSHGATVGQLDEEAFFYLRSRGVGSDKARSILINAFASDVVDLISIEPLKETLNNQLLEKLNKVSL